MAVGSFSDRPMLVGLAVLVAACVLLVGCGDSGTKELRDDPSDATVAGPRPTAPPSTQYNGEGLSKEGFELYKSLVALTSADDLCDIVTGDAMRPLLAGDFDADAVVISTSGIEPMLTVVDKVFQHLVDVAPDSVRPAAAVIRDSWRKATAARLNGAAGASTSESLASDPTVVSASESLAFWVQQNCASSPAIPTLGS